MALIKCPECNGKVSSFAIICQHCGFPIHKYNEIDKEDINKDYLEKKVLNNSEQVDENNSNKDYFEKNDTDNDKQVDEDWIKKWKSKKTYVCALWFSLVLIFEGIAISISQELPITILSLICFILSLIRIQVRIKTVDEHNILVYRGVIKNYLLIDNVVHDKNANNNSLNAILPSGRKVSAITNSTKIQIEIFD